jgi:hypothetical protein
MGLKRLEGPVEHRHGEARQDWEKVAGFRTRSLLDSDPKNSSFTRTAVIAAFRDVEGVVWSARER